MQHISFESLTQGHLSLLKKWLDAPHVKKWWDQNLQKYQDYIKGYKIENGIKKPIQAYIAKINAIPVAYIQLYNAYDFGRDAPIPSDFSASLCAIDIFIGDSDFMGKGYGSLMIKQFLQQYADPYFEACVVDPDVKNIQAIRAYEKAGFEKNDKNKHIIWMLRRRNNMITNANHYTLAVTDIERSFQFYRDVLGLKPLCKWSKGAYFLVGDFWFCLNLDESRKPEPDIDYSHFAFSVSQEDFPKMVAYLEKAGLAAFKENTSPGDSFYFVDPDGHRLEIHTGSWQSRLEAFRKERTGIEYFV